MLRRDAAAAVIAQRAGSVVGEPQRHRMLARMRVERHLLVVAAQADDGAGLRRLAPDEKLDHAPALRPAIDIVPEKDVARRPRAGMRDRKSTRLNSSHQIISYA